jgi:hypothetical protein
MGSFPAGVQAKTEFQPEFLLFYGVRSGRFSGLAGKTVRKVIAHNFPITANVGQSQTNCPK